MKKYACTVCLLLGALLSSAQNLVPNGSFEEYTECPDYWADIPNVVGWVICGGSPDYFNACRDSIDFGVPLNAVAYQYPSHGSAYCGVATYAVQPSNPKEYLCTHLLEPMQVGAAYSVSFKVSPGGFGNYFMGSVPRYTSRGIGVLFTVHQPDLPSSAFDNSSPIFLDEVLIDTLNWTTVSGVLVADSAYDYLSIGNFFDNDHSAPLELDLNGGLQGAYVVVDEVCVVLGESGCDFSNGVADLSSFSWAVFPDPFTSETSVSFGQEVRSPMRLLCHDVTGRLLQTWSIPRGATRLTMSTDALAIGALLFTIENPDGTRWCKRVAHVSP